MADMKEKEQARKTRTERELAALEQSEQSKSPKKKAKKKPAEKRGTGRDFSSANQRMLLQQLNARLKAAQNAGNTDLVKKLQARKKALQAQ